MWQNFLANKTLLSGIVQKFVQLKDLRGHRDKIADAERTLYDIERFRQS